MNFKFHISSRVKGIILILILSLTLTSCFKDCETDNICEEHIVGSWTRASSLTSKRRSVGGYDLNSDGTAAVLWHERGDTTSHNDRSSYTVSGESLFFHVNRRELTILNPSTGQIFLSGKLKRISDTRFKIEKDNGGTVTLRLLD
ncbi:MAG: hypothetical protein JKY42_02885 [Flavobacteriales bacterium]|nr:hypothetical protein [Flavobacteriales bacterium]